MCGWWVGGVGGASLLDEGGGVGCCPCAGRGRGRCPFRGPGGKVPGVAAAVPERGDERSLGVDRGCCRDGVGNLEPCEMVERGGKEGVNSGTGVRVRCVCVLPVWCGGFLLSGPSYWGLVLVPPGLRAWCRNGWGEW